MKTKKPAIVVLMVIALALILACFPDTSPRPALKFAPKDLPAGQINIPYETKIQVSENVTPVFNMFISEGNLPDGLTLQYTENDDFARITGTPVEAGTFKFTIVAMCYGTSVNGQMGQMEYTIVVR